MFVLCLKMVQEQTGYQQSQAREMFQTERPLSVTAMLEVVVIYGQLHYADVSTLASVLVLWLDSQQRGRAD